MDRMPITQKGFEKLEAELKHLKSVERPEIIEAISVAREHGDLSENAEYHSAREKQSFIEGRIAKLEGNMSIAEIINSSEFIGDTMVKFGAIVEVIDEDTEEEITYQIVGEYEADIDQGMLSLGAPLSRALIGKAIGDSIEVTTPKGSKAYEILKVSYK